MIPPIELSQDETLILSSCIQRRVELLRMMISIRKRRRKVFERYRSNRKQMANALSLRVTRLQVMSGRVSRG